MSAPVGVRFSEELEVRVRQWALENGMKVSSAIRVLIEAKLNELSNELPTDVSWRRAAFQEGFSRGFSKFQEKIHKSISEILKNPEE